MTDGTVEFKPAAAAVLTDPVGMEERLVPCRGGMVYLNGEGALPRGSEWHGDPTRLLLGELDGCRCSLLELAPEADIPAQWRATELRRALAVLDFPSRIVAARGRELGHWRQFRRYCGQCGAMTEDLAGECARRCPGCGAVFYPALAPAVITAIFHPDGRLLLAHNRKFRSGVYSLIAGFVEPGEPLEEAVRREIAEEIGVTVRNIRYFGSQSWPYPNSLMIGFTAEYLDGELRPDGTEIESAGFFTPETMPEIPAPGSIARTMIERWLQTYPKGIANG